MSPPPDVSAAQKGETGGTDSTPWYKHPLMLRAAERAAYALASAVIGAALLYADARLKQDVIKRRLWRRRKGRREGEEERRGGSGEKREDGMFRGLGRHLVLAVSVSLKLCAGVALALALVAIAAAIVPGLELRLRVFTAKLPGSGFAHTSDNDDNSDDSDDDNYAYPKFFKQFFGTAIALLLPTAVLVLGTCISAAVLEAKVIVDRIFDRMLFEGAQRAGSLGGGRVSSDRIMAATASTPPLFSQQGADSVAASRSPPWKKYMALHALEGLVIGVFVYFVAYAPFGRELKKLRTIRECPSTASLSKLWSFRDWPSLSA